MKRRSLFFLLVALAIPAGAASQQPVRVVEDAECGWQSSDRDVYCESREYVLDARSRLDIDAGQNGGIRLTGWDRDEIRVVARVQAASRRDGEARALAREVGIRLGSRIEPEGPGFTRRGDSWSVSFHVMVPRGMTIGLRARNGGISLMGVDGDVTGRTTNGGFTIVGGAGRIRGETTNGGVRVELDGGAWSGQGLDVETTNGGVRIIVPDGYDGELETGTVNGGMELEIPVVLSGRIGRTIRTTLGDGGALIRATTRNGGVVVRRP